MKMVEMQKKKSAADGVTTAALTLQTLRNIQKFVGENTLGFLYFFFG